MQLEFDYLVKLKGMIPIYREQTDDQRRTLFVERPEGSAFWTKDSLTKSELQELHTKLKLDGYVLVSLAEFEYNGIPRYWGTWVSADSEKDLVRELKRYGLSQASISGG